MLDLRLEPLAYCRCRAIYSVNGAPTHLLKVDASQLNPVVERLCFEVSADPVAFHNGAKEPKFIGRRWAAVEIRSPARVAGVALRVDVDVLESLRDDAAVARPVGPSIHDGMLEV